MSEAHGEDHVHVYETAEIHEGNRRIPTWFKVFMVAIFAFFGWYVITQIDAQPSSARMK